MKYKNFYIVIISFASIIALSTCSGDTEEMNSINNSDTEIDSSTDENVETELDSHANMDHSSSGEVPATKWY